MITPQQADRAINQLLSCIMGRAKAKASTHLEHSPIERIEFCSKLVHRDLQDLVQNTDAEHLSTQLINELDWES